MPPYIAPEAGFKVGFWGLPTSTLDWCEENYAWLHYVAEFCKLAFFAGTGTRPLISYLRLSVGNTLSNLAMILPGLMGVWFCVKSKLELRYTLCFALLTCEWRLSISELAVDWY